MTLQKKAMLTLELKINYCCPCFRSHTALRLQSYCCLSQHVQKQLLNARFSSCGPAITACAAASRSAIAHRPLNKPRRCAVRRVSFFLSFLPRREWGTNKCGSEAHDIAMPSWSMQAKQWILSRGARTTGRGLGERGCLVQGRAW